MSGSVVRPEDCEKLYQSRRGRTHLFWVGHALPTRNKIVLCGIEPLNPWLGTGSDLERERAEQRRVCGACLRVLDRLNR